MLRDFLTGSWVHDLLPSADNDFNISEMQETCRLPTCPGETQRNHKILYHFLFKLELKIKSNLTYAGQSPASSCLAL